MYHQNISALLLLLTIFLFDKTTELLVKNISLTFYNKYVKSFTKKKREFLIRSSMALKVKLHKRTID